MRAKLKEVEDDLAYINQTFEGHNQKLEGLINHFRQESGSLDSQEVVNILDALRIMISDNITIRQRILSSDITRIKENVGMN